MKKLPAPVVVRDAVGLLGAAVLLRGLWMLSPPIALMVAGLLLIYVSLAFARGDEDNG